MRELHTTTTNKEGTPMKIKLTHDQYEAIRSAMRCYPHMRHGFSKVLATVAYVNDPQAALNLMTYSKEQRQHYLRSVGRPAVTNAESSVIRKLGQHA